MTFPTIPSGGQAVELTQTGTSGTRTFPDLSTLTKSSGDLLIAIIIAYQSSATANAVWSAWGGGFTEFGDFSTATTMAIGCAYKFSTGSETGTFTVTEAVTVTGEAAMILLAIPGAHATTPPEAGGYASGTATSATPSSITPSWGAEDTLWIAVAGNGETATTGAFDGITATPPTNYSGLQETGISADVVGGVEGACAFRQLNAASEDPGNFANDTSNARWGAITIAVRPATPAAFVSVPLIMAPRIPT